MPSPLTQFIKLVSPSCHVFSQVTCRAPWGLVESDLRYTSFSFLRSGQCWAELPGQAPFLLKEGELLLLPYGTAHKMMSDPDIPCDHVDDIFGGKSHEEVEAMAIGGDGPVCQLICGYLDFGPLQYFGQNAVFKGLPEVLVLDTLHHTRLENLLLWIYQENGQPQSGSDIAVSHLLELLLLELFRSLDQVELELGWLKAMSDPRLAPVISCIQNSYQKDWRLTELADVAALSKTAFSSRFKKVTGSSALEFLRQWRCLVAAKQLVEQYDSVQEIAQSVGFQSTDVFIRNFRLLHQLTPGQYRQKHQLNRC